MNAQENFGKVFSKKKFQAIFRLKSCRQKFQSSTRDESGKAKSKSEARG